MLSKKLSTPVKEVKIYQKQNIENDSMKNERFEKRSNTQLYRSLTPTEMVILNG